MELLGNHCTQDIPMGFEKNHCFTNNFKSCPIGYTGNNMQIGRYGTVLKVINGIEKISILKRGEYPWTEDQYINAFVRDVIICKDGEEQRRKIGSYDMEAIRNINQGDVIDLNKYNILDKGKHLSDIGFNRYCEIKEVYDNLKDVMPNCKEKLNAGQICNVYNDDGLLIGKYKILGFIKPDKFGHCVLVNWDCWWFPEKWFRVYPLRNSSIKNED